MRALFPENKVRFARAEQLWFVLIKVAIFGFNASS